MFSKLKQYKELRDQAKTMRNALAGEIISVEKNGVSVTMNGNMEITKIVLADKLDKSGQEAALTGCLNDAIKKTQRVMAEKMRAMGGLPGIM